MNIGYACQIAGLEGYQLKTCIQKNASEENLERLIAHNLEVLDRMLDYNIAREIRLFRISSDIIPFGSSPVNTLDWASLFREKLGAIGKKALEHHMRLSMHPGQYTVLNSPSGDTVRNAVEDLDYHCRFLDCLGLGPEHKLILHVGGGYGDKQKAMRRFAVHYRLLGDAIKKRLVIENDDRIYTVAEVLELGTELAIPVVFDNLHNQINPSGDNRDEMEWVRLCAATWKDRDGPQKTHYSQQAEEKKPGSHSDTINIQAFLEYYHRLPTPAPDVMLEVKDKNLSAVKCIACTHADGKIRYLEEEWGRYKYAVLERDASAYQEIRSLLKDKSTYPAAEFYALVESAMSGEATPGGFVNAAQHVWGYFKGQATEKEKAAFERSLLAFRDGKRSAASVKGQLYKLAVLYRQQYLLDSYYFSL